MEGRKDLATAVMTLWNLDPPFPPHPILLFSSRFPLYYSLPLLPLVVVVLVAILNFACTTPAEGLLNGQITVEEHETESSKFSPFAS